MKKRFGIFFLTVCVVGGAAFLVKYAKQYRELIEVSKNKIMSFGSHSSDSGSDVGEGRVENISSLVDKSLELDNEAVNRISARLEKMQKDMVDFKRRRKLHHRRIVKLEKIRTILGRYKKNVSDKDEDLKALAEQLAKLKRVNRTFGRRVASISHIEGENILLINGKSLLIIDDKPVRVGADPAKTFYPLIQSFQNANQVDKIVIRAHSSTNLDQIHVLAKYFQRLYGWETSFEKTDGRNQFPIQVEVTGKLNPQSKKLSTVSNTRLR